MTCDNCRTLTSKQQTPQFNHEQRPLWMTVCSEPLTGISGMACIICQNFCQKTDCHRSSSCVTIFVKINIYVKTEHLQIGIVT